MQVHLKKGKNKEKTLFWKFRKGRAVVSEQEFSSHTAVLAVKTYMSVRGSDNVNTASSSIPSSLTSVFCLFGFLPPFSTYLSCWSSCHRFVDTLGSSVFPSASSLSTSSSVTSCFSTFPVNFNLWAWGEFIALCFFLVLLLLPCFKILRQISLLLTDCKREQALSHKTAVGGILLKFFLKPFGCY